MKGKFLALAITVTLSGCKNAEPKKETVFHKKSVSEYSPIGFIQELKKKNSASVFSMEDDLSNTWVKSKDLDSLISLVDSKEKCNCYLNPLSSYIPNDSAEVGGFAIEFLKAFRQGRKVNLGLYACPKGNEKEAAELKNWWKDYGKTE